MGAHKLLDAAPHLACGLVGKRQRHNAVRLVPLLQQVHYLIRQHTRLARARTGYHQLRPAKILHGAALLLVELLQILLHGHTNLLSAGS